ncbi:hypothetical protein LPJ56_005798, partial [Coemansia sp. RSA 2599]
MFGGFQGDYKRQRNINLGGGRRNEASRSNAPYDALVVFVAYYNCQQQDVFTLHAVLRALFETRSPASAPRYNEIASMVSGLEASYCKRANWSSAISRLLGLAMETYMRRPAAVDNELLQRSLACATCAGIDGAGLPQTPSTLQSQVLLRLIKVKGLYAYISRCIGAAKRGEGTTALDAVVALAIRPFGIRETQVAAIAEFSRRILSIPGLPNKLGARGSADIIRIPASWAQIAEHVCKDMQQRYFDAKAGSGSGAFGQSARSDFSLELTAINTLGNMAA